MAGYTYKEVCHRADFREIVKEWVEDGIEVDQDPNYDGDYWLIAAELLEKKDKKIQELTDLVKELENDISEYALITHKS